MKMTGAKRVVLSLLLALGFRHLVFTGLGRSKPLVARFALGLRPGDEAYSNGHHDADEQNRIMGADVTALMNAAHEGDMVEVLKLVSQGADLDATDDFGWTAVRFAARNGQVNVINTLIQRGCDMNKASVTGRTPLMSAVGNGHERVVELLMRSGADPKAMDKDGLTAYDIARFFYEAEGLGGERMCELVASKAQR
mmetsp:Transcript_895/g.1738  ORF Transcript_895/g.1738 Transcript_895/m.1738 type:complete len:196 (+) Transcript_895:57-644(+)|eukprot:CAMPEP_0197656884 /NCGR_PEP_ID=MMETSP1338-20131121/43815_1 /TAXON_ID=43686 ORGANISM="Pelagodinium beii, Strain RCC1491" /NCGR_SAMPLE_ID=MMETSP1338 /ASSEMBLY_ACC=CAM_ASM_000754 /LENGTH=195 /DNA_ID=CAMNT_0043233103 /DNA_START=57 /DNA_END=644 /DNA_ORIENTATION=-